MARIRSIKPEFWSSGQVVDCSFPARLLFIGIWNFADDHGVIPNKPRDIKARVFPGDDITSENVRGMIDELISVGLLFQFEAERQQYLVVTGWKHQRIDKPSYKYPDPPSEDERKSGQLSLSIPRMIVDHSATEGRGGEGIGEEGIGGEGSPPPLDERSPIVGKFGADGPPLFVQIIAAFDEAIAQAFGQSHRRPAPHQNDGSHAKRFIEAGADLELCRMVFEAICQRHKAQGKRPPWSLEYFQNPIADAIAARDKPMPEGRAGNGHAEQRESTLIRTKQQIREEMQSKAKIIAQGTHLNSVANSDVQGMIQLGWLTAEQAMTAGYEP